MSFPKKEFVIGSNRNSVLKNKEVHKAFLSERTERLKVAHNKPEFYTELESIFTEFVDVYNYDLQTAVVPEPTGTFKNTAEKQMWIEKHLLAIEFKFHLGKILCGYHDWLVDNGLPDIILGRLITDYPNLYERVMYEYISVLKAAPPKYPFKMVFTEKKEGASEEREKLKGSIQYELLYVSYKPYLSAYALPSLIEHFMIGFLQQDLVDKLILDVLKRSRDGVAVIDATDMEFLKNLMDKNSKKNGSKEDAMERCHQIVVNSGISVDRDTAEVLLGKQGNSPLMLGAFLKNSYAQAHIKKPYYDVLEMLFSTKKVNLRNSIMHGASILFDPFDICFSSVLLQIFWGVIDRSIYK